jgi:predicted RNase H-like HicB family nuclease
MHHFDYGFSVELINNDYYQLKFLDIPTLIITGETRDKVFTQAQTVLDDYLYNCLKTGKKIPLPKVKAPNDKRLTPSEAIKMALEFYVQQ